MIRSPFLWIFFLGIVKVVNSSCETTLCECPNIASLLLQRDPSEPLPPADCNPNLKCDGVLAIGIDWSNTEIPKPPDADIAFSYKDNTTSLASGAFFGIICEKGEWYITQYPNGVQYQTVNDKTVHHLNASGLENHNYKSKIIGMLCDDFYNSAI